MSEIQRVLLTGATGFVGRHVYPELVEAGFDVVSASRNPERAERGQYGRKFVRLDLEDYASIVAAMRGCQAAVYLVHSMAGGAGYEEVEARSARHFARAAEEAGLLRVVYLGGPRPTGPVFKHLESRLRTGELLRAGRVPTIELQATMVVGAGGESWRMVRDLAARLPLMVLPRWLESRSQPIAIADVAIAIRYALQMDLDHSATYALPGPETLSAREILARTARLLDLDPPMMRVPVITPRLSSYWIALVTRADPHIARQLVEGLRSDLTSPDAGFWKLFPAHTRVGFDDAARRALRGEAQSLPVPARLTEWVLHQLTPRSRHPR